MTGFPRSISSLFGVGEYMSSGIRGVANAFFGWVTREEKRRWVELEWRGTEKTCDHKAQGWTNEAE